MILPVSCHHYSDNFYSKETVDAFCGQHTRALERADHERTKKDKDAA
jgi:hypothetical protein